MVLVTFQMGLLQEVLVAVAKVLVVAVVRVIAASLRGTVALRVVLVEA